MMNINYLYKKMKVRNYFRKIVERYLNGNTYLYNRVLEHVSM